MLASAAPSLRFRACLWTQTSWKMMQSKFTLFTVRGMKKKWIPSSRLPYLPFFLSLHTPHVHSHHRDVSSALFSIILHSNNKTRPITIMEEVLYAFYLLPEKFIHSDMSMHISVNLIRCNEELKGNFQKICWLFTTIFKKKDRGLKLLTNLMVMCWCQKGKHYVDGHK